MKGKGVEGEIVQVEGGHILRSTSQKDRHSKVYTSKGPRDRRVRLAAHTAIQFYDVQDRLGYDRPSKAVDWLIEKAKDAIDMLDELPPWHPNEASIAPNSESNPSSGEPTGNIQSESPSRYAFQQGKLKNTSGVSSSFIPPDPDNQFTNPMKSFFPTTSSGDSLINFQNFPHDIMSRASYQAEDLGLSLHTLQDQNSNHGPSTNPGPSGSTFQDNYQRMDGWSASGSVESRVGFLIDSHAIPQQAFRPQNFPFSQRELLLSNYSNFIRHNSQPNAHHSADSSSHFPFNFQVPARIHGENEPETHD